MKALFNIYRPVSLVVGVMATALWIGVLIKVLNTHGSVWYNRGEDIVGPVGLVHGFLYIGYFILAFFLAVKTRWPLPFMALMLVAGLLPLLIFWVERQVDRRFKQDYPQLFEPAPAS